MYTSSIINKYGDTNNVKADLKTLHDIIARQGQTLLIDVIAETCGDAANKFKMSATERATLTQKTLSDLSEALNERL